jgi:predicted metal-dependent enzyme (double-stranded beta helix superfamily)
MTFTRIHKEPTSARVYGDTTTLIVHGQGVIFFDASGPCTLRISEAESGLIIRFTETNVLVNMFPSNEPLVDKNNSKGIVNQRGAYYWFSLDSQNQRLYAGIGEARMENVIYRYQFGSKTTKPFLESLTTLSAAGAELRSLLRDPITGNVPLLVKNTEELTMESIASGAYMPKANLSLTSQKLYDCIAGKQFTLNTPDFPDFTRAIEYSIATPGKWCYERLKQKANEFNKDKPNPNETYLRITLGENNGESPGIPYVMEIWPSGHFSPIHNHGGSSAVIRVLNGSINVSLFPFLSLDELTPFGSADFKKDDITWISPSLNQVHQLKNMGKNTCITIQCYMYEDTDTAHYDYFDYLDTTKGQFEPDSDMDFIEFKKTIKEQWPGQCCSIM